MKAELQQYQMEPTSFWQGLLVLGVSGYDVIEHAEWHRWHAIPAWGKAGYTLGDWPLVIIFFRDRKVRYELAYYVEGDVAVYVCPTREIRNQIVDELAFFHWKHQGESWVEGYDSVEQLPDDLRGPYRTA